MLDSPTSTVNSAPSPTPRRIIRFRIPWSSKDYSKIGPMRSGRGPTPLPTRRPSRYCIHLYMTQLRVIHYGLGPIGAAIAELVAGRANLQAVGAVDVAADKAGCPLRNIAPEVDAQLTVRSGLDELDVAPGAVVVHSTGSALQRVLPQLLECLNRGYHVVSTCEELSYPWDCAPQIAAQLDEAAKRNGVTLLGTGVNPGFAMDYLPVVLSGASATVTGVSVHRVQDAGVRREPLQRKIGATLTVEQFQERVEAGTVGHVGLPESAQAVAAAFGWKFIRLDEQISPLLATEPTPSALGTIPAGHVTGVHQGVTGYDADGAELIRLTLDMAVGLPDPRDEIELRGVPATRMKIPGGLHGDIATAAVVTNCISRLPGSPPGLRVMADIAPPHP